MSENYIPYGPEWEAEIMKMKKIEIIRLLRVAYCDLELLKPNEPPKLSKMLTESMSIQTGAGGKVRFAIEGGYEGDLEYAKKFLEWEKKYTVKSMEVGRSHSYVTLEECPDQKFNTILFFNSGPFEKHDWFKESQRIP